VRRRFATAAFVVVTAAIGWAALEVVFAVAPPGGIYAYDAEMGFRVRPHASWGAWHANALGFNDRDHPEAKPPGVFRVVVLGDSFNWAGGPEGNYTRLLERRLGDDAPAERVEILNFGYPGTHPGEHEVVLRRYGMRYAPDLVIVGIVVGNDFLDAQPWRRVIPVGGELTPIDLREESILMLWGAPFSRRSHVLRHLAGRLAILRLRLAARARGEDPAATGARLADDAFYALERQRMSVAALSPSDAIVAGEATVFTSLAAMQALTAAHGARLAVAAYPEPFQVDDGLRAVILEQAGLDPAGFDWERPQRRLAEYCRAWDLPYADLLPAFRAAHAAGNALYLRNEPHWNAAGQALAASALTPVVRAAQARPTLAH
jgi:hypothetical protein